MEIPLLKIFLVQGHGEEGRPRDMASCLDYTFFCPMQYLMQIASLQLPYQFSFRLPSYMAIPPKTWADPQSLQSKMWADPEGSPI